MSEEWWNGLACGVLLLSVVDLLARAVIGTYFDRKRGNAK